MLALSRARPSTLMLLEEERDAWVGAMLLGRMLSARPELDLVIPILGEFKLSAFLFASAAAEWTSSWFVEATSGSRSRLLGLISITIKRV